MHEALVSGQIHVAVDLLITTVREGRLGLLLSRRTSAPFSGCWALPGRMVSLDESAYAAAEGLLAEMLPTEGAYMEQLFTFADVGRDPRGRVISIAYLVIVPWQRLENCLARPEVSLECFFLENGADALMAEPLAFDHAQIIQTGVRRLRGKIDYSDLGFRFLDSMEAFSLPELQTVFEAVLGQSLDNSNFRRSILSRYEAAGRIRHTEDIQKRGRGRPAVLYRYFPE